MQNIKFYPKNRRVTLVLRGWYILKFLIYPYGHNDIANTII